MTSGREKALIRSYTKTIHLRIRMLDSAGADAREGLPEAGRIDGLLVCRPPLSDTESKSLILNLPNSMIITRCTKRPQRLHVRWRPFDLAFKSEGDRYTAEDSPVQRMTLISFSCSYFRRQGLKYYKTSALWAYNIRRPESTLDRGSQRKSRGTRGAGDRGGTGCPYRL